MHLDDSIHRFGNYPSLEIHPYKGEFKIGLMALLELNTPMYFAPEEAEDFSTYLDKEVESYFVVLQGTEVVAAGGINYFELENLARLSWDIVHPQLQGKGIGQHLVSHRLNIIKNHRDIKRAVVRTSQLVYQFYEKMGFELEKTQEHFWAPDLHLYQMSIDLV